MTREHYTIDPDKTKVSVKLAWGAIITSSSAAVFIATVFMNQSFQIKQMAQQINQLVTVNQIQSWTDDLREANPGLKVPRVPRYPASSAEYSPVTIAATRIASKKE